MFKYFLMVDAFKAWILQTVLQQGFFVLSNFPEQNLIKIKITMEKRTYRSLVNFSICCTALYPQVDN